MAQANLTQTPFFASGETGPKEAQRFAQGHEPASGLCLSPPPNLCTSLLSRDLPSHHHRDGPESRPAPGLTCCCPMGFQGGSCQMPRQFYFPSGCRVLRATVRLQALPFHSEPGFLFTPSVGSQQNKGTTSVPAPWGPSSDSLGQSSPLGVHGKKT